MKTEHGLLELEAVNEATAVRRAMFEARMLESGYIGKYCSPSVEVEWKEFNSALDAVRKKRRPMEHAQAEACPNYVQQLKTLLIEARDALDPFDDKILEARIDAALSAKS